MVKKFALVHFGNEESYGLLFAGTEFKKHGDIKFFDYEMDGSVVPQILEYKPDFIAFSPMTTFYKEAVKIEKEVKETLPNVISIYGGHHSSNCGYQCGDISVVGTVHDLDINARGIIRNGPTRPSLLTVPARPEYFRDIPRFKDRYRKMMLSVTGCPFNCTYCSSSTSVKTKLFGKSTFHLDHRSIDDIITEALYIKDNTEEIEWVDDDVFMNAPQSEWLNEFLVRWQKEIGLPMYVSTTTMNAEKASHETLELLRKSCNCIGIGVQSIVPSTLKMIKRNWDNREKIQRVYNKLTAYGFNVNLQMIIGFPVDDPIADGLETLAFLRDIAKGSVISCYPLQIYPNTEMDKYIKEKGFKLSYDCQGDTNEALPALDFGPLINNRIKNIFKFATMIVKYGVGDHWLNAMLDMNLDNDSKSSKQLSTARYFDCISERIPEKAEAVFEDILTTMNIRF